MIKIKISSVCYTVLYSISSNSRQRCSTSGVQKFRCMEIISSFSNCFPIADILLVEKFRFVKYVLIKCYFQDVYQMECRLSYYLVHKLLYIIYFKLKHATRFEKNLHLIDYTFSKFAANVNSIVLGNQH